MPTVHESNDLRVFFDSSAFVKRYVGEAGSESVLEWCDRASEIALSAIALTEIISAFCRLSREGRIDDTQYRRLKALLLADIEDVVVCDLTPAVLAQAISSLETSALRAVDAIHIGSAVAVKTDLFVSADQRQLEAASRAGLRVEAA